MSTANFPIDNLSDGCAALAMDLKRLDIPLIADRRRGIAVLRSTREGHKRLTLPMIRRIAKHTEELCAAIEGGLR